MEQTTGRTFTLAADGDTAEVEVHGACHFHVSGNFGGGTCKLRIEDNRMTGATIIPGIDYKIWAFQTDGMRILRHTWPFNAARVPAVTGTTIASPCTAVAPPRFTRTVASFRSIRRSSSRGRT